MNSTLFPALALATAAMIGGLLFGLAYFAVLGRSVVLFLQGNGLLLPAGMTLARLATAAAAFAVAAHFGALTLLTALLGFLAARLIALRLKRSPQ